MVFNSVVKLNVLKIIARAGTDAKLSPSQTVSQMPMLASYSVVTSYVVDPCRGFGQSQRVYGLGPVAKYFVNNENGASRGPLLDLLQDKILKGVQHSIGPTTCIYSNTEINIKFNYKFNATMIHHTKLVVQRILKSYEGFENLKTLVDVDGGLDIVLRVITCKHSNLKGINYDLSSFRNKSYSRIATRLPLPVNGKVIAVDAILPLNPHNSLSNKHTTQVDLFILASYHPGGKERTEQEFLALAIEAGFKEIRKVCVCYDSWVMEFYKRN
ncbi:hypothetical protein M9H77_27956 [Catharanthus roseus]|uniref:Uncharacterized protein n=1 Tax=Catharanthus roseus TaxID=4058 RepID=A0ACC0AGP9_CATRO|nr:hypothetical protein M9H77_27956 [Catharanthus roseus]